MKAGDISSSRRRWRRPTLLAALDVMLFFRLYGLANAGTGARFAVGSSFWTLFVAILYSLYSFFSWPYRQLFRVRWRKRRGTAVIRHAVILGFDSMDPELTERFITEGRLSNLSKLRDQGTFNKLRTAFPAISPVAWSTFMTGVNPGRHNIYDFLARDAANYLPDLSSAEIKGPKRRFRVGRYTIPPSGARIQGMRRGTPIWHWVLQYRATWTENPGPSDLQQRHKLRAMLDKVSGVAS